MAGLYIHVPFCVKRCLYCDFYSNTDMGYKSLYIDALVRELELRKDYISGEQLDTIYFGGGTPSQLQSDDFGRIFEAIYRLCNVSDSPEITIEANPDDMTQEYVASLRTFPFNRISMGVQSFKEEDLRFLNRRHDSRQAVHAVELCKKKGFSNISIDLIYGLPGQMPKEWDRNLDKAISLDIPHISAYHLIYEEGTALYKLKEAERITPVDEEVSLSLFTMLIERLRAAGYLHYEISNFAKPGMISRHNSAYWAGKKYLGLGPSAHSYNGESREWNISSLPVYIQSIESGKVENEAEALNANTRYNDFIITRLRTMWGIRLNDVQTLFGDDFLNYLQMQAEGYLRRGLLVKEGDVIRLSRDGIFVSDGIMSDLLRV